MAPGNGKKRGYPMTKCIHLIERDDSRFTMLGDGIWGSGYWVLSKETAKKLIGGSILFHRKKSEPSFFGGTILDYRVENSGRYSGCIVFRFKYVDEARNMSAGKAGWNKSGLDARICGRVPAWVTSQVYDKA